jgi:hypothetical protein
MWEDLFLAIAMYVSGSISVTLGAMFFALCSLPVNIPLLGHAFRFALTGPIKLTFILKLGSWAISASGPLLGFLAFSLLFHVPNTPSELWIVIAVSAIITLNRMHYIVLVQTVDFHSIQEAGKAISSRIYGNELSFVARNIGAKKRLLRALFVDLYLPQLFMLVVCYGLVLFGVANLNYIPHGSGGFSIENSLLQAYSILNLGNTGASALSGTLFNALETIWSIIVFLYIALFLMLASSLIDEEPKSQVENHSETKNPQTEDSSLMRKAGEDHSFVDTAPLANPELVGADGHNIHSDVDKQAEAVVVEDIGQQDVLGEPKQNAPNN